MTQVKAVLIAGPTASGKSGLAIRIASAVNGVVINADSMQVYRVLRTLTARPTDAELARVPHDLYGFVDPSDAYSAGRYAQDVRRAIAAAHDRRQLPVVVGGTGLYFQVLLEGLSPIPPIPDTVRARWRAERHRHDPTALHAILQTRDPEMARRLSPTDPQRIVRALEVHDATGQSLAVWQSRPGVPVLRETETLRLVMTGCREMLYARADARFDAMIEAGALEEVRALAALRLPPDLPAMRAVGVPPLLFYLAGEVSREEAMAKARTETRRYIKRQQTWIKRNMISWKSINLKFNERKFMEIINKVR